MHQSLLKFDNRLALVILTGSPGAAQVPQLFTLITPYAMEQMADAYLAEVAGPDQDLELDKCTVDLELLSKERSLAPPYGHASGTTRLDCDGCLAPHI
jgi:hypothetical protein